MRPPPRAARGGRRRVVLHRVGDGRRDRARRRPHRHRLRRPLCAGGGPGPPRPLDAGGRRDRRAGLADRRRYLRLHQRPHHGRGLAVSQLTPVQIVAELDRYIVGQQRAKRAVAIALRNRWRRQNLPPELRDEVAPKNIIMIGPTGVGKTEIARRLAKLAQAPFLKVEASKYTEVGYVGRDVESMIRDLVELAVAMVRDERYEELRPQARSRPCRLPMRGMPAGSGFASSCARAGSIAGRSRARRATPAVLPSRSSA